MSKVITCGICGNQGHNKRSCTRKKASPKQNTNRRSTSNIKRPKRGGKQEAEEPAEQKHKTNTPERPHTHVSMTDLLPESDLYIYPRHAVAEVQILQPDKFDLDIMYTLQKDWHKWNQDEMKIFKDEYIYNPVDFKQTSFLDTYKSWQVFSQQFKKDVKVQETHLASVWSKTQPRHELVQLKSALFNYIYKKKKDQKNDYDIQHFKGLLPPVFSRDQTLHEYMRQHFPKVHFSLYSVTHPTRSRMVLYTLADIQKFINQEEKENKTKKTITLIEYWYKKLNHLITLYKGFREELVTEEQWAKEKVNDLVQKYGLDVHADVAEDIYEAFGHDTR